MSFKKNRIIKIAVVFVLAVIAASLFSMTAFADDEDEAYYVENAEIIMEVASDKSVEITERYEIYFNEESHGIIRTIPTQSLHEYYTITDAQVISHPFTYNDGVFKIGREDRTVIGRQVYTICYTINLYADSSDDFDFFYPNVIGLENDLRMESVEAKIIFPEDAQILDYNITSGEYGSVENEYARGSVDGNVIKIRSTKELPAFNGISIEVRLEEGVFADAPVLEPDFVVDDLAVTVTTDEHGVMSVTEKYKGTMLSGSGYFNRTITENLDDDRNTCSWYVENLEIVCDKYPSAVDCGQRSDDVWYATVRLSGKKDETVEFAITYDVVTDFVDEDAGVPINIPFDYYESSAIVRVDDVDFRLETNALADGGLNSYIRDMYKMESPFDGELKADGGQLTLRDPLGASESFILSLSYEEDAFVRKARVYDWVIPLVSVLILAVTAVLSCIKKEKQLVPTIEFYPPDGLNPAEVGYIIDNVVNNEDITSLIFYWASHGQETIEFYEKNKFKLNFVSELDDIHRSYEKAMFASLWRYGQDGYVLSSQLEEKFYPAIHKATAGVKKIYSSNRALIDEKANSQSILFGGAAAIVPAVLYIIASAVYRFSFETNLILNIVSAAVLIGTLILLRKNREKKYIGGKSNVWLGILAVVLTIVGVAASLAVVGGNINAFSWLITAVSSAAAVLVSPKIVKRTDAGTYLLGRCIGFKQFLETAERERLEMLLEQTPDYYYNILPYAQVLGVSKIWEEKFKDLVVQPPTWYTGYNYGNIYMTRMLLRSMNSVSRTMSSVPAKSSGGGRGGFGGGFGGGGFSGGGFGGGGMSRW